MQALAALDVMQTDAPPSPHEQIRAIALQLFVAQGFQSVSLRQLATAVGMQAGSLYNHIESKDALLFELIEQYENDLLLALPGKRLVVGDPLKALNAFIRSHVLFTSEHRQRWLLARLEFRCLTAEQQRHVQRVRDQVASRLTAILQAGMDQARFVRVPVDTMVPCMLAMLNEISSWHSPGHNPSLAATVGLHTKMIHGVLLPSALE
ncbi:TetR/AcrR family transcriptional regulator [Pseudomonas sp. LP_7_YM]|uniref:TetR/AcrR family transcriptional regulator n=1 Tax=Pseudomonas sp. LP_7_YM TaxID=2485137 RepID=UPI0010600571|nr:TetR/AcrR family transcriptional regulator [Pseudomonas sp. LP_7_YM]TDV72581.1 TetR family transcriptional regulator [Pseudomonas sp. LP_7_YM]